VDDWGLGDSFLRKFDITVELRPTFNTPVTAANLSVKAVLQNNAGLGRFTFENVPVGVYILRINRPGYLTRAMEVIVTPTSPVLMLIQPPGTLDAGVFNLWWGDCDDSGNVDNDDLAQIILMMNLGVNVFSPYYNAAFDLNGDATIDNDDLALVINHWGRTYLQYAGASGIDFDA